MKGITTNPTLATLISATKVDSKVFDVATIAEPDAPTVIFNIRGTLFETYRVNLYRRNVSNLSKKEFLSQFYRESQNDYFFDRDPSLFSAVLEYQRTGELHIPVNVCGKVARQELEFWGISESHIEKCCWNTFDSWNTTYYALKQLEETLKNTFDQYDEKKVSEMRFGKIRAGIWTFLTNPHSSNGAKIYGGITILFIMLSVMSFIIATHPAGQVKQEHDVLGRNDHAKSSAPEFITHPALMITDYVCDLFFTCELLFRIITCPDKKAFCIQLLTFVDVVSLIPDYLGILSDHTNMFYQDKNSLEYLHFFRIFRTFRVFRLVHYIPGLWILVYTFKASLWELVLMLLFMAIGMIVFASFIYYCETEKFQNIPIGLWWALITMTTVGYGDIYPENNLGYLVGSVCATTGLLMVGFTVPIVVNHFVMYYTHMQSLQNAKKRDEQRRKSIGKFNLFFAGSSDSDIDSSAHTISEEGSERIVKSDASSKSSKLQYRETVRRHFLRQTRVGMMKKSLQTMDMVSSYDGLPRFKAFQSITRVIPNSSRGFISSADKETQVCTEDFKKELKRSDVKYF